MGFDLCFSIHNAVIKLGNKQGAVYCKEYGVRWWLVCFSEEEREGRTRPLEFYSKEEQNTVGGERRITSVKKKRQRREEIKKNS